MIANNTHTTEQLPDIFEVEFVESTINGTPHAIIRFNGTPIGNPLNDNSLKEDFYRYHDIFHFTYATLLDWSPCVRAMLNLKRKSNPVIDRTEDGARAQIAERLIKEVQLKDGLSVLNTQSIDSSSRATQAEEGISLLAFTEAKQRDYFIASSPSQETIKYIKSIASSFEVKDKSDADWSFTISKSFELFNHLVKNKGGKFLFNRSKRSITIL